ncbi:MAG: hypothetical protein D3925_00810 [Candidatus Electrothrix sp. AR5]|nr:hypothetical protein [Candidatus Electrothrix sp. AR5]
MKKKTYSACIMAALLTACIASTQASASILAEGNISVYKGGNLADTMTGQNPVDEKALLVCNEKCMIKSTGVSIVGTSGTTLAVKSDQEQFNLLLQKGKVDFILSGTVGKMAFHTTDGQYTVADVVFNASTNIPVRGYMQVTEEGKTTIGVYDGRMVFNTIEGAKIVDSNNYIVLAQSEVGGGVGAGSGAAAGTGGAAAGTAVTTGGGIFAGIGTTALVAGGLVTAAAVWGVVEYAKDDDDDTPSPRIITTSPSRISRNPSPNR